STSPSWALLASSALRRLLTTSRSCRCHTQRKARVSSVHWRSDLPAANRDGQPREETSPEATLKGVDRPPAKRMDDYGIEDRPVPQGHCGIGSLLPLDLQHFKP